MRRILIRYCVLPLAVGICSYLCSRDIWLFSLALLLAAPSAVTGITISRSVGGLVFPVAFMILISAAIGAVIMFPLLGLYGMPNLVWPAAWLTLISVVTLLVPLIIVLYLRREFPIETATLAERNSVWSTVLLTLFAVLAFQHVEVDSFWPFGAWAFGLGIVLRGVAYLLLRRRTLYAVDEYVAMSYPNIFFVIVLAFMIGVEDLLMIATWFLLPMFALAPVDEWICKRLGVKSEDRRLISFLGIEPAVDSPQAR
jgi:hypothetical protein